MHTQEMVVVYAHTRNGGVCTHKKWWWCMHTQEMVVYKMRRHMWRNVWNGSDTLKQEQDYFLKNQHIHFEQAWTSTDGSNESTIISVILGFKELKCYHFNFQLETKPLTTFQVNN